MVWTNIVIPELVVMKFEKYTNRDPGKCLEYLPDKNVREKRGSGRQRVPCLKRVFWGHNCIFCDPLPGIWDIDTFSQTFLCQGLEFDLLLAGHCPSCIWQQIYIVYIRW